MLRVRHTLNREAVSLRIRVIGEQVAYIQRNAAVFIQRKARFLEWRSIRIETLIGNMSPCRLMRHHIGAICKRSDCRIIIVFDNNRITIRLTLCIKALGKKLIALFPGNHKAILTCGYHRVLSMTMRADNNLIPQGAISIDHPESNCFMAIIRLPRDYSGSIWKRGNAWVGLIVVIITADGDFFA